MGTRSGGSGQFWATIKHLTFTFGIRYNDIIWHNNRNVIQYYTFHYHRQHAFIFFLQIFSRYFIPAVFQMLRSHIWKPPLWSFLPLYSSFLTKILSASVLKTYPGIIMSNRKQLRWLPNYATVYGLRTPQWGDVFEMKEYRDNGTGNTFTFPVWLVKHSFINVATNKQPPLL